MKSLKKNKIYKKFSEIKANNVTGVVEMPEKFADPRNCLKWLRNHDEAYTHALADTFEHFDALKIRFASDYMALHGRSMYKPVSEIW